MFLIVITNQTRWENSWDEREGFRKEQYGDTFAIKNDDQKKIKTE